MIFQQFDDPNQRELSIKYMLQVSATKKVLLLVRTRWPNYS
jgi:hypothetical protein